MIAAAVHNTTPWWHSVLSFGWFDVVLVLVLAFGFWRGRKRGMSREALPTSMWLLAVIGAGLGYQLLGDLLLQTGYVKKVFGNSFNERTAAYVTSYLAIALVVFILYSILKNFFREKLSGSNAFGSGEYYLGTISGMIRYACMVLFVLALLNAPYYSVNEINARKAYNARWYGGGLQGYSGDFIPGMDEVQAGVFQNSLLGPAIKNYFSAMLINGTAPQKKPVAHS